MAADLDGAAALVALVLPLCSAYARAQHAATGHDLRRAVAIRDGDYQARTPSEGAADRALAYVMAAALYPAAAARYTATAYGWAEEAGVDVAALAREAGVVPATREERWGDG